MDVINALDLYTSNGQNGHVCISSLKREIEAEEEEGRYKEEEKRRREGIKTGLVGTRQDGGEGTGY